MYNLELGICGIFISGTHPFVPSSKSPLSKDLVESIAVFA